MKTVAIIGLGYVGLPVACLCVKKGLTTYGVDIDQPKIEAINAGKSPLEDEYLNKTIPEIKDKLHATTDMSEVVPKADIVVVCVPTPVHEDHMPNLNPLKGACASIAKVVNNGALVIIESTIFPGTVEEIIQPIFKDAGKDVLLVHCPERIDPGNKKFTIESLPRVVGGITEEATKQATEFYETILDASVTPLSSVKAAEATKIMENTFRDVNIAFVNEMAKSFDKAGINISEVIKGASSKPFGFMPHYPGAGVGGHCISVDPYYLIAKAKQLGFDHKFLSLAREINESMPAYTIELLEESVDSIDGKTVAVLGLAYKAGVDDDRESPSHDIIAMLGKKGAKAVVWDPFLPDKSTCSDLQQALEQADYVILATNHSEFVNMDLELLKKNNISAIIDGRNCLDKEKIKAMGIAYHGIGQQ